MAGLGHGARSGVAARLVATNVIVMVAASIDKTLLLTRGHRRTRSAWSLPGWRSAIRTIGHAMAGARSRRSEAQVRGGRRTVGPPPGRRTFAAARRDISKRAGMSSVAPLQRRPEDDHRAAMSMKLSRRVRGGRLGCVECHRDGDADCGRVRKSGLRFERGDSRRPRRAIARWVSTRLARALARSRDGRDRAPLLRTDLAIKILGGVRGHG